MKRTRSKQKPHLRRSKKGRVYRAGKGSAKTKTRKKMTKCTPTDLSQRERKQVFQQELDTIAQDLKKTGKARIPNLGIIRTKTKRGVKKGTPVFNPFEKKWVKSKGKPARKIVKFNAAKSLKEKIN